MLVGRLQMHVRFNSRPGLFIDSARVDDFSALEDGEAISESKHKGNMLFHDKHRGPQFATGERQHFRDPVDD